MKEVKLEGIIIEKGALDSNGDKLMIGELSHTYDNLPILETFNKEKQLGWAKVYKDKDQIKANMILDNNLLDLYPAIGGIIKKREGQKITDFQITSVSLSSIPNSDPTIKTLREQIMPQFPKDRIDNYKVNWLRTITWLGIIGLTITIWYYIFKWIF